MKFKMCFRISKVDEYVDLEVLKGICVNQCDELVITNNLSLTVVLN